MLHRIAAAVEVLRPRGIARTGKLAVQTRSVVERLRKQVVELRRELRSVQERDADRIIGLERQLVELQQAHLAELESLQGRLTALSHDVTQLGVRESQLRALARRDSELEARLARLSDVLNEPSTAHHVRCRIARSPLHLHPLPYIVVDDLLPSPLYEALLEAIPPVELFADRPVNKRQVGVPPTLAPAYSRRVWQHIAKTVAPRMITPAVLQKFRDPLQAWLEASLAPEALELLDGMELTCTDGRILLRGPGYCIPPHRDPKWGFITCLMYLARPDDDSSLGTHLYSVEGDEEASNAKPYYVRPARCRREATIEFRPNRALIFLNSAGAHGAEIPEDAPASLERYLYQFRIGPGRKQIRALLESLPEERRACWEGKLADD